MPEPPAEPKKKCEIVLPWWTIIFAYILCFASVAVAFWYCVEVGGTFGKKKSEEWLFSFVISTLESVLLEQPLKVMVIAIIYALIIKSPKDDDEDTKVGKSQALARNEEYLHSDYLDDDKRREKILAQKLASAPDMPDLEELNSAREKRFKEMKMHGVIREMMFYFIFLYMLMMVAYSNRDPSSFQQYNIVNNRFHSFYNEFPYQQPQPDGVSLNETATFKGTFMSIGREEDIWFWAEHIWLQNLYNQTLYGSQSKHDQVLPKSSTRDWSNILFGKARLRQVRIPFHSTCKVHEIFKNIVPTCRQEYSFLGEEEAKFMPGWVSFNETDPKHAASPEGWNWQSGWDMDGWPYWGQMATYGGGGYVVELDMDQTKAAAQFAALRENHWIDSYTRGIFVEYVLYNPNLNLFTVSMSMLEMPNTGGIYPLPKLSVIRLDRYVGAYMFTVLAMEVIVGCFIVFFTVREGRLVWKEKKKYFGEFWNCIEFSNVIFCWVTVVMYMYRLFISNQVMAAYRKLKNDEKKFINFQYVITWDELYNNFMAWIVFVSALKFLKLLRFNKRMSMLAMTLKLAAPPLLSFLIVFFVVFFAFAQMMFLFCGMTNPEYSTFMTTIETLFSMMLNKFNFHALEQSSPFFGPLFFALYTIIVVFVLVNIFMSIINAAIDQVKRDLSKQSNEFEVIDFMMQRLKKMLGMGEENKPKPVLGQYSQYVEGDSDHIDPEELDRRAKYLMARLELYIEDFKNNDEELRDLDLDEIAETAKANKRKKRVLIG